MDIRTIKWYLNAVTSPLGIIINIFLFFMIKYRSSQNLNDYKKVLYMGCCTDIVYGIILALSQPTVSMIDRVYFVFTEGLVGNLPPPWSAWAFIPNIFIMYFSVTSAPIQFLYRYMLLCRDRKLSTPVFLAIVVAFILVCAGYSYIWADTLMSRGNKDEAYYAYLLNGSEFMVDGKLPYYGTFSVMEKILTSGYSSVFIVSGSYCMLWFCAISIFLKLKKVKSQYTQKAMRHQNQITTVLMVEALTPFITIVIPLTLDIVVTIFNIRLYWAGQAVTLVSSFAPPINGIVKLTVISSYRRAIMETIIPKTKLKHFVSTLSVKEKSTTSKKNGLVRNGKKIFNISSSCRSQVDVLNSI